VEKDAGEEKRWGVGMSGGVGDISDMTMFTPFERERKGGDGMYLYLFDDDGFRNRQREPSFRYDRSIGFPVSSREYIYLTHETPFLSFETSVRFTLSPALPRQSNGRNAECDNDQSLSPREIRLLETLPLPPSSVPARPPRPALPGKKPQTRTQTTIFLLGPAISVPWRPS
jgi:hypothetical protein